jgi:hypothetical protein
VFTQLVPVADCDNDNYNHNHIHDLVNHHHAM